jgi:hypothetical protein
LVLVVLVGLRITQMAFLVLILYLVPLHLLVVDMVELATVHQPLEVLAVVVVVVLELLELEAQELQVRGLLVVILHQVTIMLAVVAVLVQLEKTLTQLVVEMVAQVFVQP